MPVGSARDAIRQRRKEKEKKIDKIEIINENKEETNVNEFKEVINHSAFIERPAQREVNHIIYLFIYFI